LKQVCVRRNVTESKFTFEFDRLEGLKRLCESAIGSALTVESVVSSYELALCYGAPALAKSCALFALQNHEELVQLRGEEQVGTYGFELFVGGL
jgi:hypothetical protein